MTDADGNSSAPDNGERDTATTGVPISAATDADGLTSAPIALYTGQVSISSATATIDTDSEAPNPTATLMASNLLDWGSPITGVTFYLDTSASGIYDASTAQPISGTTTYSDGSWTLPNVSLTGFSGPQNAEGSPSPRQTAFRPRWQLELARAA